MSVLHDLTLIFRAKNILTLKKTVNYVSLSQETQFLMCINGFKR